MTKARSNATANAAKGDLTVGNGTNLSGVLGVGSNGDTIVADSSTSTGLVYSGANQINPIINSSFEIWQRGISFAAPVIGSYIADRWNIGSPSTTGRTYSRQTTGLENFQYCIRAQRNSGDSGLAAPSFSQSVETVNAIPYAGKTVTFSFYARKGADFSQASSNLLVVIATGTGTDQKRRLGTPGDYTGNTTFTTNKTLTTDWQRFSHTVTFASTTTEFAAGWEYTPVGTAGAADYFEVTGVQLDIGSVALPYRRTAGTIQGELAACQRYYWRVTGLGGGFAELGQAAARSTTVADQSYPLPVTMRVAPTSVDWAVNQYLSTYYGNTQYTVTSVTLDTPTTPNRACTQLAVASGLTAGTRYMNYLQNTTSAFIGFSAEL